MTLRACGNSVGRAACLRLISIRQGAIARPHGNMKRLKQIETDETTLY